MKEEELKNRLNYLRMKFGSMEKVARELDVSLRTVQLWFNRNGKPNFKAIGKIEELVSKLLKEEQNGDKKIGTNSGKLPEIPANG